MKHLKLIIVFVLLCGQSLLAQISNAKMQWSRNTTGLAYDNEYALKGYRDPANGSVFVLYQGSYNYGLTRFDNSGASVMNFRNKAPGTGYSFGGDFKYIGNSELVLCGEQNGLPHMVKINTNGDTLWTYREHTNSYSNIFYYKSLNALTVLASGNIVGGGDRGDTAYLCNVSAAGNLNWNRTYTPTNYSIGFFAGLQTDNFNNIYACGTIKSTAGDYDAFVTSFDPNGNVLWEKIIQGAAGANDSATAILLDNSGNVYVAGIIKDIDNVDNSTFIVKYNASGGQQYLKKFHQSGQYTAKLGAMNIDVAGNAALVSNCYTNASTSTPYVQKYNATGTLQWTSNYTGGLYPETSSHGVSFDLFGNVLVSGETGVLNTMLRDEFVVKFNSSGNQMWSRTYDNQSASSDQNAGVLVDNSGNSYVLGYTGVINTLQQVDVTLVKYSSGGLLQWEGVFNSPGNLYDLSAKIIRNGSYSIYSLGSVDNNTTGRDMALIKYNTQGNLLWQVTYDNNNTYDQAISMVQDGQKNIYVLGNSAGSVLFKYDTLGTLVWSRQYSEYYASMSIDPSDNIYLAGGNHDITFVTTEFIARKVDVSGNTVYQSTEPMGARSFVARFCKANATGELFVFGLAGETGPNRSYLRVAKFTNSGTIAWSYDITGNDSTDTDYLFPKDLEMDNSGNIIIVGAAKSIAVPTVHTCLMKIAPDGTVAWRNDYSPGAFDCSPKDLEVDSYGDIWTLDEYAFVNRFNPQNGALISQLHVGDPNTGNGQIIRRYKQNELLIVASNGGQTMSLIKTDTLSNSIWRQEYANSNAISAGAVDMDFDAQGRIYIIADSPESEGSTPDIVTMKYCDLPVPAIATSGNYQQLCPGSPVTLTAAAGSSYLWNPSNTTQQTFTTDTTMSVYAYVYQADGCYQSTDTVMVTRKLTPSTPSICLVTVDSLSTHNIIAWDKTGITGASAFNIYREDVTNIYSFIAAVPYDSLSEYHDYGANPNITTKRYKISAVDTCGQESDLSPYHNTLYITNNGGQFSWNPIYTIENSPNPVDNYILMREDVSGSNIWNQVASTAGTQFIVNDPGYASFPGGRWRVETDWNISCLPTRGAINTSRSNVKSPTSVDIKALNSEIGFSISPNPANSQVIIKTTMRDTKVQINVYNMLGQKLISVAAIGSETTLNIEQLEAGTYFIEVSGLQKSTMKKLIKY